MRSHPLLSLRATVIAIATPLCLLASAQAADPAAAPPALADNITPSAVLAAMERVADWQLANPSKHRATDWTQAAGSPA